MMTSLTPEGKHGAILLLHEGVKRPPAAGLGVRVLRASGGDGGSCRHGNRGGLSCSVPCWDGNRLCRWGRRLGDGGVPYGFYPSGGLGHLWRWFWTARPKVWDGLRRGPRRRSGTFEHLAAFVAVVVLGKRVPASWRRATRRSDVGDAVFQSVVFIFFGELSRAGRFLTRHAAGDLKVKAAAPVIFAHGVTLALLQGAEAGLTAAHTGL